MSLQSAIATWIDQNAIIIGSLFAVLFVYGIWRLYRWAAGRPEDW